MRILHITDKEAWVKAQANGIYRADTLESAGFIHCCRPEQLKGVLDKWFPGVQGLISLEVDTDKVRAKIVDENLEGGEEQFPHIYGPINLDAITDVKEI